MSGPRTLPPTRPITAADLHHLAVARAERSAAAGWTEVRVAWLAQLWDEGHVTAEIGRRMGLGKNAIIGKVHRLGLPPRPSPIQRSTNPRQIRRTERAAQRRAAAALAAVPEVPVMAAAPKPFVTHAVAAQMLARPARYLGDETCCWPMGKRLSCDAPVVPPGLVRTPYCLTHLRASVADKSRYSDEALRALAGRADRAVSNAVSIVPQHDEAPQ